MSNLLKQALMKGKPPKQEEEQDDTITGKNIY
jgi:hypothetical protein